MLILVEFMLNPNFIEKKYHNFVFQDLVNEYDD